MTREIKFRAWNIQERQYYFQESENTNIKSLYDLFALLNYCEKKCHEKFAIEQYTGLKDKNGMDIYEGDIISANHYNPQFYVIMFIEGGYCAYHKNVMWPIDINHFYDSLGCHIEVIGNIHTNPELLEE